MRISWCFQTTCLLTLSTQIYRKDCSLRWLKQKCAETLKLLLERAPTAMTTGLKNWQLKKMNGWNILFYKGKNYIPWNIELQQDIVKSFHNHETAGHPGEIGTYNAVWQHYWWPGLWTFIKDYVQGCGTCQQFKIDWSPSKPTYIPTEGAISKRSFANCSMDLITDLPPANGYDLILVVVDQGLSKGVILVPCNKWSLQNKQPNFCWKTYTSDLDFWTRLFQTEDPSLHLKPS